MRALLKACYLHEINPVSLEFCQIILSIEQNHQDIGLVTQQQVHSQFERICNDFDKFIDFKIAEYNQKDATFGRRWAMLKASQFNEKLWIQFEDIANLCEAIILEWSGSKVTNYIKD